MITSRLNHTQHEAAKFVHRTYYGPVGRENRNAVVHQHRQQRYGEGHQLIRKGHVAGIFALGSQHVAGDDQQSSHEDSDPYETACSAQNVWQRELVPDETQEEQRRYE